MNCRICGSETRLIVDEQFDNRYHHCPYCLFISIAKEDVVSFEEERVEYDRHENSIDNEGYVNFFRNFLDSAVMPFINRDGLGLDFGSGPEPVMKQVLKRDYDSHIDHYDLHYQPVKVYEGKLYDFIISTEVIEHILDPGEAFEIFAKHLKEGGVLSLMTLFHPNDDAAFLKWWYRRDVTHISFFRDETFEKIAELYGLEVIYSDNVRCISFVKK